MPFRRFHTGSSKIKVTRARLVVHGQPSSLLIPSIKNNNNKINDKISLEFLYLNRISEIILVFDTFVRKIKLGSFLSRRPRNGLNFLVSKELIYTLSQFTRSCLSKISLHYTCSIPIFDILNLDYTFWYPIDFNISP